MHFLKNLSFYGARVDAKTSQHVSVRVNYFISAMRWLLSRGEVEL